jgi:hypothetical protein
MGNYLLHHPWVQFYLVVVGALAAAAIWERLCRPPVPEDDSPARPTTDRGPCRDGGVGRESRPPADSKKPFRPVSGTGR